MNGQVAGAGQGSQVRARTYALLTDGSTVEIRPAQPGDVEDGAWRARQGGQDPELSGLRTADAGH